MADKNRNAIIASNIKSLIKRDNITQKKLAESINISPSTLSDYMNLRSNPSHGVIQKIADYFNVLKSDIDTTYKNNTDGSLIESIYNQLEPELQQLLIKEAQSHLQQQLEKQNASKVVSIENKKERRKNMTLAAHDPDENRVVTDEDIQNIHDVLDEIDAEYDKKNKTDK